MNTPLKESMFTMFKSNLKILARSPICLALLFCLSRASLAGADAIYDFSLPANGAMSALSFQLRFQNLLPSGSSQIIPVGAPIVTSLSFPTPGFNPAASIIGLQITPTATLVGLAFSNSGPFTEDVPDDFFAFSRAPLTTGTFASISGEISSSLPLATPMPTANLTVSSVPEPVTALLVISGLSLGWCGLRMTHIRFIGVLKLKTVKVRDAS